MKEIALHIVISESKVFRDDFYEWLNKNWHVYQAFSDSAIKVWNSGFKHYSARTIMEVLRHRSNIREIDGDYKVSNNIIPDCARLFVLMNPSRSSLFTIKNTDLRLAA